MPHESRYTALPIRGSLASAYVVSLAVSMVVTVGSVYTLIAPTIAYPTKALMRSFLSNDVVNLAIGLPALLVSMRLARRGDLLALLSWPGTLLYVLYNYLVPLLSLPLNTAFFLDFSAVALSLYAIVRLVTSIDGAAVQEQLAGAVHEGVGGAVLFGLGLLTFLRAAGVLVTSFHKPVPFSRTDLALSITDLLIAPAMAIGGVLLWRRKALGYAVGLGLLFQVSMLFIGLILFMSLQPRMAGAPFALIDVVVVASVGLVAFIPLGLFVRGATARADRTRLEGIR